MRPPLARCFNVLTSCGCGGATAICGRVGGPLMSFDEEQLAELDCLFAFRCEVFTLFGIKPSLGLFHAWKFRYSNTLGCGADYGDYLIGGDEIAASLDERRADRCVPLLSRSLVEDLALAKKVDLLPRLGVKALDRCRTEGNTR